MMALTRLFSFLLFIPLLSGNAWAIDSEANTITAELKTSKYLVTGYRSGDVEIVDLRTQETISKLQLNPQVVRALFPFDQDVIAISQLDRTTFFDLNEKKPIHTLNKYLIGVNEDTTIFLTYRKDPGSSLLSFYRYPSMQEFCAWKSDLNAGVNDCQFSQDGKYVVLQFDSRCPFPDRYYPINPGFLETLRSTRPVFCLLSLVTCERIDEFSTVSFTFPGRFPKGGDFYELVNPGVYLGGKPYDLGKRFHLEKRTWEIDERQDN